ncbi:hypothetical protein GB931_03145 [Modestobacter sp. I12A-02628]|uniref:Uncharacterized protein n=1 Tax=Goekera deserti TaxID=2497753 RepID=A0A7K3WCW8_9ACTN|nr:hypothetical protein [Goekera deserti]MPQ96934.1 hypothetical protein [Goekera deserti]NDI46752.1 hypothetical protein [Goekera deserti]NEL54321.1 hypothetical protein [Goekera deserti]
MDDELLSGRHGLDSRSEVSLDDLLAAGNAIAHLARLVKSGALSDDEIAMISDSLGAGLHSVEHERQPHEERGREELARRLWAIRKALREDVKRGL